MKHLRDIVIHKYYNKVLKFQIEQQQIPQIYNQNLVNSMFLPQQKMFISQTVPYLPNHSLPLAPNYHNTFANYMQGQNQQAYNSLALLRQQFVRGGTHQPLANQTLA